VILRLEPVRPAPAERNDIFYCPPRRRRLPLGKCLDDFTNANALEKRRRVCYRCPLGRKNRHMYAHALPLDGGEGDE
jgi:hypothetical protein